MLAKFIIITKVITGNLKEDMVNLLTVASQSNLQIKELLKSRKNTIKEWMKNEVCKRFLGRVFGKKN